MNNNDRQLLKIQLQSKQNELNDIYNKQYQLKKQIKLMKQQLNYKDDTAKEKIENNGYEDVIILENDSYDNALIGVSDENRAVYSYEKMVQWLIDRDNISEEEAREWIDYNTIRALPYAGQQAPIIVYDLIN